MFDKLYFNRYEEKNILGMAKGERPYLYSFWIRKIQSLVKNDSRVLEVGCGSGFFLKYLKKYYNVIGSDISKDAAEIATKRTGVTVNVASAEELLFAENLTFEAIVAFDLIEHLILPNRFIEEAYRILKPGGVLIVSTPNPNSLGARLKKGRSEGHIQSGKSDFIWFGWTDHTHVNIKTKQEWIKLFSSYFEVAESGSDTLWDVPYFKRIPIIVQKLILVVPNWLLSWRFGFFNWNYGENSIFIFKKKNAISDALSSNHI